MDTADLLTGFFRVWSFQNLSWIFFGVFLGMVGGTLPGISGVTMMAVILPIMYKMPLDTVVLAITGIYASSIYSSSTSGILYNIPGGAPGVPTTIEGYRLTLKGRSSEALAATVGASFFGNTFATVAMVVTIPLFQYIVTYIGTAERALFGLWALVIICVGVLTRDDPIKGLVSMGLGLTVAIVGTQGNTGTIRYVTGLPDLWEGIHVLWLVLGLFAIPQLMRVPQLKDLLTQVSLQSRRSNMESPREFYGLAWRYMKENVKSLSITSLLGTIIGIIPGIGSLTAGWLGYTYAQRFSKHPEEVGEGSIEAILSIESSNNAALPGALIPLFSLGIPGSATAAIIMGAFILAGVYPGPQMMAQSGAIVWCIIWGIMICGIAFFVVSYPFRMMAGSLIKLPVHWLVAIIGPLAMLGSYLAKFSVFGANVTLIIALLAVGLNYTGVTIVGVLLGSVLGNVIEIDTMRAYQVGGLGRFTSATSLVLLSIIVLTFFTGVYQNYFQKRQEGRKKLSMVGQDTDDDTLSDGKKAAEGKDEFTRFIVGLPALLLGLGLLTGTSNFPRLAKIWPMFCFWAFLVAPSVVLLLQAAFKYEKVIGYIKAPDKMTADARKKLLDGFVIFAGLAVCMNIVRLIGFVESTALFALAVTMYMNPKKMWQNVLCAVVIGFAVWAMKVGFAFVLPIGPLGI
jgi:putative tricarboxylic transport membrane protein